jgi:hypothetical protein
MITDIGKNIIAKYLIGDAPAYASFIALGCGAEPLESSEAFGDYSEKSALDFEMFRVPISSRGYVNDNGVNKVILTAQLPTEERYEISEIGIYSAGANSLAGRFDSKTISAFSGEEQWQLVKGNTISNASSSNADFPEAQNSIINETTNIISVDLEATASPENLQPPAIKTSTSNGIFTKQNRVERFERPRYLSNVLMLKGDTSYIYTNGENIQTYGSPNFLQITGLPTDLSKNSSSDLMKLAFSIIPVNGDSDVIPEAVNIIVEFSNSDRSQYAWMQISADDTDYRTDNRYVVATKRLDELFYNTGQFSWRNVSIVKVYVTTTQTISVTNKALTNNIATLTTGADHGFAENDYVRVSGVDSVFNGVHLITDVTSNTFSYAKTNTDVSSTSSGGTIEYASDRFYVALDALRLDNVSTINPVYGLTGYSVVQNTDKVTIVKSSNTTNYIEYRFILDVT